MLTYELIKELCKKKGVTVTGTEKELEFARGSLCKVDTNKPSMEKVQKLANYFNVSVEYLMTGNTNQNADINQYEAKDETERRILMLCRKAGEAPQEEKEALVKQFESTIDMYLQAKGIKKE